MTSEQVPCQNMSGFSSRLPAGKSARCEKSGVFFDDNNSADRYSKLSALPRKKKTGSTGALTCSVPVTHTLEAVALMSSLLVRKQSAVTSGFHPAVRVCGNHQKKILSHRNIVLPTQPGVRQNHITHSAIFRIRSRILRPQKIALP